MKKYFIILLLLSCILLHAQSKSDSVAQIQNWAKWYDLDFTNSEADSMMDNLLFWKSIYVRMHKRLPTNDLAFPFAFKPAPVGYKIPMNQEKINWQIPSNVTMPKDKNDLAFYSIMQLASLIKNKKISSVELTKFFIERLKKWGDTLESVITITEDLAMQQAKQADEDLKKGNYHGLLHGIPYGLKDLFAV